MIDSNVNSGSNRVLLVEDESNLRKLIKMNLELEGYEVDIAEDGAIAVTKFKSAFYNIIVLDIMLPKMSGISVLENIRLHNTDIPVIIISARDTSSDRIKGLKTGADDYLIKPFEMEELLLRMDKLISRAQTEDKETVLETYDFGENRVNFSTFTASNATKTFDLGQKEVMILKFLISKKDQVVSRQEILKHVWGYDVFPSTRTIDNFISALRKYFESDIKNPKYIKSIRGIGYKFSNPA